MDTDVYAIWQDPNDALPLKSLTIDLSPIQSGSGDPSPDNMQPITGKSEVNIVRAGKNLAGGAYLFKCVQGAVTTSTIVDADNHVIRFSASAQTTGKAILSNTYRQIVFKPNTRYTLIFKGVNSSSVTVNNIYIRYTDGTSTTWGNFGTTASTLVYTSLAGKTLDYITKRNSGGSTTLYCDECGVFEGVLTADDFESWKGDVFTAQLGDTVYAGTVDAVKGTGQITSAGKHFSELTWTANASPSVFNGEGFLTRKTQMDGSIEGGCLCDSYKWFTSIDPTLATVNAGIALANSSTSNPLTAQTRIYVRDSRFSTPAEFTASFQDYDPLIVCPLKTPIDFTFDPVEIKTLPGDNNNIWSDAGDVYAVWQDPDEMYLTTFKELYSVANAIRTKGDTSAVLEYPTEFISAINAIPTGITPTGTINITTNGTHDVTNYASANVNVSSGGGVERKDVNFIDYDGTILHSYTTAEFAQLDTLPANPSHGGLTAQGWNWTLAQIKAQLAITPDQHIWVGQMYVTASGDTEIDVTLPSDALEPCLRIAINGTVEVDWGDNTTVDTMTGTNLTTAKYQSHSYSAAGNYTIKIHVVSGSFNFYNNASIGGNVLVISSSLVRSQKYSNTITIIRLGNNVSIGNYAFSRCPSLTSITIPSSITSIDGGAFQYCNSLTSITIPSGVTSISNQDFQYCPSLTSIAIPSSVTSIGTYAFYQCHSLSSIIIPNNVTSIGTYAFGYCSSLTSITIPSSVTSIGNNTFQDCRILSSITIPNNVTSIGSYAFQNCQSLTSITIPSSVTSISTYAFYGCYTLTSITIPNGVTSISNSVFYGCYTLTSITIPNGVTSIGNSVFEKSYSLISITIPNGVTSIGNNTFTDCYSLQEIHFKSITPATVASSNAFSNVPTSCIIYVPTGSLSAYTSATNYPNPSTYTYVEE